MGTYLFSIEMSIIGDFRLAREVDENYALLEHYATSSGNFLPTFRHNISVPLFVPKRR
jgi:hypothetical protein